MADVVDDDVEATAQDFDPASLPLGTFTSFDVSDQPMYTTAENAQYPLNDDQKNAVKKMVESCATADQVARRIEVQGAWMLELLDRGFHRLIPKTDGGWSINGAGVGSFQKYGVFGANVAGGWYDTNVIGEKNDTIVSLLTREIAESTFFATRPGDPDDETYAAAANCLKHFIAEDNKYGTLQAGLGRLYCTDETAVGYTRPVADAQKWGYEDVAPDVVPETADGEDPDAAGSESDRPKIRTQSEVFGKLCRKVSVVSTQMKDWPYCGLSKEYDIAKTKAEFPWIASKIKAGDMGIAELKLDRLARQSINTSMQSNFATGDSLMRDVTKSRWWLRPEMYMDCLLYTSLAVASGHGIGKSALVGMIISWAMSTCANCRVAVTANTGDQLRTKTIPEVSKWFRLGINAHWWNVGSEVIKARDAEYEKTWRTDFLTWSLERTEAFAGLHNKGKRIVVICDEASAIPDPIKNVIEGALTDEELSLIHI